MRGFGLLHNMRDAGRHLSAFIISLLALSLHMVAQDQDPPSADPKSGSGAQKKGVDYLFSYLNMAGTATTAEFQPLTQSERTRRYLKTMTNPLGFAKAAFSAGLDQWKDKPVEWEQGASGYGKRFANILGQYSIQRTVTFGMSSALHEDNRYFNSGKRGFWPRTWYAVTSGILARHDDGSRNISVSQLGGVAAGAFLSRLWQPTSQHSAGDGAVSFGLTMSSEMGFGVAKECLPDLGRALSKRRNK